MLPAEDDGVRHTGRKTVEEEVMQSSSSSEGGGSQQEGPPSKIGQIMWWAWLCQSLKTLILQVVVGNGIHATDAQQIKMMSNFSVRVLWLAMPMFYVSLTHQGSTSTPLNVEAALLFLAAINTDAILILLLPEWGATLVRISWLLLELATSLLFLSFNKHYAIAILATLLLAAVIALLQPKLQQLVDRHVLPRFKQDIGEDLESQYLGHLLDLSQGIASFGGLFMAIAGHFMVGPVNVVGFFFFCAIQLGLYLFMVVTVGAVSRTHAKSLATVVIVLVVLMFIAACIPFLGHSGR